MTNKLSYSNYAGLLEILYKSRIMFDGSMRLSVWHRVAAFMQEERKAYDESDLSYDMTVGCITG
jgi:hypothetical protein